MITKLMGQPLILFFALYVLVINLVGFGVTAHDKKAARTRKWRVPERTLFLLAAIGGGPGIFTAMLSFRHKTKHPAFMAGIPALFVMDMVILYFVLKGLDLL